MKAKVITGNGARGLMAYVQKPGAEFIDGTQSIPANFLRETAALRSLRPDCQKAVLHFSLSLPDGEALEPQQWKEAVAQFRKEMNLEEHSFYCVRHRDAGHDHVHIIANKIGSDGKLWDTDKSALRAMAACTKIETSMHLQMTKTLDGFRAESGRRRNTVSDGSVNEFRRTGKVKSRVAQAIQDRKAKEQKREQDRGTHQPADGISKNTKRPDQIRERTSKKTPENGEANHSVTNTDRSSGSQAQRPIKPIQVIGSINPFQTSQPRQTPPVPTLGGRLIAHPSEKWTDLHWQGRDRPTFRWSPETQRLDLLARSDEKNIKALFDAATEAGLCTPALVITGTDEFKQMAATEAARRNLAVDDRDPIIKQSYEQERARIIANRSSELDAVLRHQEQRDREQEQQRQEREQERIKAELARLENEERIGDDRREHMKMEMKP